VGRSQRLRNSFEFAGSGSVYVQPMTESLAVVWSGMSHALAPFFSVIIVNHNGGDYIRGALNSLRKQTFRDFEVILLDNASTDGSAEGIDQSGLPHFCLLSSSQNLGFAGGNNKAVAHARGEWLALLNPDAEAAPDWLETVARAIREHSDTGVFASAQYDLHDPDRLDGAGDAYLAFGIPWRGGFGLPATHVPGKGECFSPCGASAIYRRDLFRAHDGFDERFFCYCEDVDLGFRMQLAGERCIFLADAIVYHAGSGISGGESYFTVFHGNRNRTWTYLKNMPLLLLFVTLPGHVAIVAYIYVRNRKGLKHSGMLDGVKAGFREGWALRRSKDWRGLRFPKRPLQWLRSMAWWPWIISGRRPLIRKLRP